MPTRPGRSRGYTIKTTLALAIYVYLLLGHPVRAAISGNAYLSPVALIADRDGKHLYVAEFTAKQVAVFDLATEKVSQVIPLPDRPSGMAMAPEGSCLYVTGAQADGPVHIVNLPDGSVTGRLPAGHTPIAPVVSPDGKTLYVCNRFDNTVSVVDLALRRETATIPVPREPVAAVMSRDGQWLFVANHLPAGAANVDYAAAVVSVIDTGAKKAVSAIQLPNGSTGLRDICISPDGRHVYVTHILARYQLPTTQLERGWINTNALSIINVGDQELNAAVLLDEVDQGRANPWSVVCTADGKHICVTHAGTHDVSVIDRVGLHEKLATAPKRAKTQDDLMFLTGLRRRLKLLGNGPRGLVVVGTTIYAAEYFTDSLGKVDLGPSSPFKARSLALGPKRPVTAERRGEMLFNDARLCFQNWQSCASCHPEGRADGLNWDLLNDGIGNPKNAKSLLLAHETPPAMITGVRDRAETAVRTGLKHIHFLVHPESDAEAIDAYLKSMKPVPSPYLLNNQLSPAAQRGQKLFKNAGCEACHSGPRYTDLDSHKVYAGMESEDRQGFDTPTLIEVWRTAPYLYDGRAATLKDVLTTHNVVDTHGITSNLTAEQIQDLAAFVLSQ